MEAVVVAVIAFFLPAPLQSYYIYKNVASDNYSLFYNLFAALPGYTLNLMFADRGQRVHNSMHVFKNKCAKI